MARIEERLLVCNCQRTMDIDGQGLARALGLDDTLVVQNELCRTQVAVFERALAGEGRVHVACTQEAPLFRELAEERGVDEARLRFTNIRERAGWCADRAGALPKMAALLAEAAHVPKPAGALTLKSEGVCLVYGAGQQAVDVASELSGRLNVTVLLTDIQDVVPPSRAVVPIMKGRIKRLHGHLGAFGVEVDGYAAALPSSRASLQFAMPRDGARASCDIVFDLSGGPSLLTEPSRRDGYLVADPGHAASVAKAMLSAIDLVGEFEKPQYVGYDAGICAHARSGITGCTRCIDNCPVGVISPDGDGVTIDHAACAGCGVCSAVCPTGAVSYAYPARLDVAARARILLEAYRRAGGGDPVILLQQDGHGAELIAALARFGRGLPVNVLPMQVYSVTSLGHEILASILAYGATRVLMMVPPDKRDETAPIDEAVALLDAILGGLGHEETGRIALLSEDDPDALEEKLYGLTRIGAVGRSAFSAVEGKREMARLAFSGFRETAPSPEEIIELPAGAPYGRIVVDSAACTLCLSCVGACPANALSDHPDRPQLGFTEQACVQCGVCVSTCPEKAIRLEARYSFAAGAASPAVMKSEDPFECVRCGKAFGTKSSIERVLDRLKGHAMFRDERQLEVLQMCEDCRVIAVAERAPDPMRMGTRPRIMTTDDYIEAEQKARSSGRKPEDFIDD